MNKINYLPDSEKNFLEYLPIDDLQIKWKKLHNKYKALQIFPLDLKQILIADFCQLVDWYFLYISIPEKTKLQFYKKLQYLFNYTKYYNQIIAFFADNVSKMDIYSCFYCDISIAVEYNKNGKRLGLDLDHFLPKGKHECPLLALSLKNFVPSCQVCNSRVKSKTSLLEFYKIQNLSESEQKMILQKLSPTSKDYEFTNKSFFYIRPKNGAFKNFSYLDNLHSFGIKLRTDNIYEHEENAFLYEQRYNSVPILSQALSLMDLKRKYPISKIIEIKDILNQSGKYRTSVQGIEEIIFRKEYDEKNHSTLSKLKHDILD